MTGGARFCWRERTERVNWRLLRNLQLTDVLRRGDATLLEPYALHLTFARLPVVVASLSPSTRLDELDGELGDDAGGRQARNAWFVVRVFQLAMEYLLFLRARDGTVVDSLREELLVCEKECELLVERARKWKDRSRSGERQVEKLHQVLQSIAKLLQIEGATPNAVTTIESLLRDLVPIKSKQTLEPNVSYVEEARVCALCGKMFSSQEFLDKHVVRRHPGMETKRVHKDDQRYPRRSNAPNESLIPNQDESRKDPVSDMNVMLRAVEQTLQEHQATLRSVAQEESDKLHSLYQQLHLENQLAEEMRSKRLAVEKEVEQRHRELDEVKQNKEDLAEEIRVMKEQLQFLAMKNTLEAKSGGPSAPIPHNSTLQLELKRLEETVTMLKEALSAAREELQRAHQTQGTLLKEKTMLESQLHEVRNHSLRLEAILRKAEEHVPTTCIDQGVQATVTMASTTMQTDALEPEKPDPTPAATLPTRVPAGEAAVQTDELGRAQCIDSMIQTDPDQGAAQKQQSPPHSPTTASIGVGVEADLVGDEGVDSLFHEKCASILEVIQRRAEACAHEKTATNRQDDAKLFNSIPRRRYLRSRFHHDERAVGERISSHMRKLEQTSLRYGVPPKSAVLASEHVEVVQRALHAHLEVLPSEVLQRMIDIESAVNSMIRTHWMPQEKSRQQALEHLKADLEAKSQANQGLVRQAMLAFASEPNADMVISDDSAQKAHTIVSAGKHATPDAVSQPQVAELGVAENSLQSIILSEMSITVNGPDTSAKEERHHESRSLQNATLLGYTHPVPQSEAETVTEGPNSEVNIDVALPVNSEPTSAPTQAEPSPISVQEIRRQVVAVREVKVVSVSPRSSPPKSPSRMYLIKQDDGPSPAAKVETPPELNEAKLSFQEDNVVTTAANLGKRGDAMSSSDVTTTPTEAVQHPGTSVMPTRGPSSFSAKHPESQLGIVIPSRYDPDVINVHGLHDDPEVDSASDFSHPPVGPALLWSSSAGRSDGASERSFSALESSEMSYDASIPSLGSEGLGISRSFPSSSTEQAPPLRSGTPAEESEPASRETSPNTPAQNIGALAIQEVLDAEENSILLRPDEEYTAPVDQKQFSPRSAAQPTEVMAFDDSDSDIEEVMLA